MTRLASRGKWCGQPSADRSRSKPDGRTRSASLGTDRGNGPAYPRRLLSYAPLDESGHHFSRLARVGHFPQCDRCAVLPQGAGLRLSDAWKRSGVAPRREAEEHVGCGTIVCVPLPDWPVRRSLRAGGCLAGYELPWCDVTTPGANGKGFRTAPGFSVPARSTAGATRSVLRARAQRGGLWIVGGVR